MLEEAILVSSGSALLIAGLIMDSCNQFYTPVQGQKTALQNLAPTLLIMQLIH